jgi:hypothetical protein
MGQKGVAGGMDGEDRVSASGGKGQNSASGARNPHD